MLEFEDALARILAEVPAPAHEAVTLAAAHGRVLAEQVRSPIDLPPFDNSAMDGYAVRSGDVAAAKPDAPVRLRVMGKIAAGEPPVVEVLAGGCVRLFTGSPMPRGADAVVMQEETRPAPDQVGIMLVLASAHPGENVRKQGEDISRDAILGRPGEILTAGRIGLLAAAGLARIWVGRKPVIGLLATGSELRDAGTPLSPGEIYDSNRFALAALAQRAGAHCVTLPSVADSAAATRAGLTEAFTRCDIVVTTGGVSVGELDFVKLAFEEIGGSLQFWKVAIKPGRPFVFGRWDKKLLFGLPGNPVSAFVTFLLLVRPALLRWQGANDTALPAHPGVLAEALANPGERRHFLRVRVDTASQVRSAGAQASHIPPSSFPCFP